MTNTNQNKIEQAERAYKMAFGPIVDFMEEGASFNDLQEALKEGGELCGAFGNLQAFGGSYYSKDFEAGKEDENKVNFMALFNSFAKVLKTYHEGTRGQIWN